MPSGERREWIKPIMFRHAPTSKPHHTKTSPVDQLHMRVNAAAVISGSVRHSALKASAQKQMQRLLQQALHVIIAIKPCCVSSMSETPKYVSYG